jgi:hypothetical protein
MTCTGVVVGSQFTADVTKLGETSGTSFQSGEAGIFQQKSKPCHPRNTMFLFTQKGKGETKLIASTISDKNRFAFQIEWNPEGNFL